MINPDLFTNISDMLEDVMQASLPKVVHMVSVTDLGQGSEGFRILGVKWLPKGAANRAVDIDGNLKSPPKTKLRMIIPLPVWVRLQTTRNRKTIRTKKKKDKKSTQRSSEKRSGNRGRSAL